MLCVLFFTLAALAGLSTGQPTSSRKETCCQSKIVGGISYTLSSQMDTTAFNCLSNCAYHKDGDTSVQYCFAKGYQNVVCKDDPGEEREGILIAGGSGATTSTEVFLPGTGQTCTLPDLPDERYRHTLDTVADIGVLCGGGANDATRTSCLQFSQSSGTWTGYATTLESRYGHTSWVSPDGLVLKGGWRDTEGATTSEIVNGGMNFTLVQDTSFACSIQLGDSVIITGRQLTSTVVSRYNLKGHVEDLPSLSQGRWSHGCGSYPDGEDMILVVAGGWDYDTDTYLSSTEVHLVGSSLWTEGQPLPRAMAGMASVSFDQKVMFIGGSADGGQNSRSEILAYSGQWTEEGQLGIARSFAGATKILVTSNLCN